MEIGHSIVKCHPAIASGLKKKGCSRYSRMMQGARVNADFNQCRVECGIELLAKHRTFAQLDHLITETDSGNLKAYLLLHPIRLEGSSSCSRSREANNTLLSICLTWQGSKH